MPPDTPHYRPELDGLRAIAVLAVILFHLDPSWLPGGFAGVDVFLVLSGYLVTANILRERAAGTFRIAGFYQRRIARILPAFFAMAIATLTAAKLLYSSWDYAATGSAFGAALLSIANFHQLGLGGYFQLSADAQPLLHCWSLSLEEQFYFLFPAVLAVVLKIPPRLRLAAMALPAGASLAWCVYQTKTAPIPAFYLLPSRAWELLAGSLLAMLPHVNPAPRPRLRQALAAVGLTAICATGWLLHEGIHFPGPAALLPVLGTAACIRYGGTGPVHRLLSRSGMVLIGRLSYSLYLWHWPVFSFIDYSLPALPLMARVVLKLTITLILSAACHRLIENPARRWLNQPRKRNHSIVFALLFVVGSAPLGYAIHRHHYLDASNGRRGTLSLPVAGARKTLILAGDSQGSMYGALARELAAGRGWNLLVLSAAGEDPLAASSGPSAALHQHTLDTIRREKPVAVLLACHWIYKLEADPARLARTVAAIAPHTDQLVLLTQPPLLPPAATRAAIRQGSRPPWQENPETRALRQRLNQTVRSLAGSNISVVDTEPFFTRPDGSLVLEDPAGRPLFHDPVHLSAFGADVLKTTIEAVLR